MSSEVVVIRFPDGDAEFYAGAEVPLVGEKMTRRGAEWFVARVNSLEGRVALDVLPFAAERDESWPTPYDFIARR
jgi:hypothetical protein